MKDGILRQNVVLMSGLLAGIVAAGAGNFENAVVIAAGFTLITFFTVLLCRVIPRRLVYTVRIILYAVVGSLVYIPVVLLLRRVLGVEVVAAVGIYLPVLATNPVILSKTETRFYVRSMREMMGDLFGYVIGFDLVCLFVGIVRDVLVNNRIGWFPVRIGFQVPALETTFGGLIVVGVLAGLARACYARMKQ